MVLSYNGFLLCQRFIFKSSLLNREYLFEKFQLCILRTFSINLSNLTAVIVWKVEFKIIYLVINFVVII